jgi:hypothetical protein
VSLTLSPPLRIIALSGLAAALILGVGLTLVGHKHQGTSAAPAVITHHPFGAHAKTAAGHKAAPTKHAAKTTKTVPAKTAPARKVAAAPKAPVVPAAERAALAAGLPAPLAHALGVHSVVVVELYQPRSEVGGIAFAEAQAGAALAGAGFVSLNVLSKADVQKLTEALGQVLPVPGLLVYTRPATLTARIDGFVDKDTVAQAAQNAAGNS